MTRGLVALAALVLVLVACGSGAAAEPCWKQVQSDWTDNNRIDRTYRANCYDKAIEKLGNDLRYYSEAPDVIQAAKERMLRAAKNRKLQSVEPGNSEPSNNSNSTGDGGAGGSNGTSGGVGGGESPLSAVLNLGPSAADKMPLPLLIVAFMALLLMGAGAAGLVSRHLQSRRGGPPSDGPTPA